MILKASQRGGGQDLAVHLMKMEDNVGADGSFHHRLGAQRDEPHLRRCHDCSHH
jgi:hypothetical protein